MTIGGAYEVALRKWGLTPDYINDNWPEELFVLMFQKLAENVARETGTPVQNGTPNRMSEADFLEKHSDSISYVRC